MLETMPRERTTDASSPTADATKQPSVHALSALLSTDQLKCGHAPARERGSGRGRTGKHSFRPPGRRESGTPAEAFGSHLRVSTAAPHPSPLHTPITVTDGFWVDNSPNRTDLAYYPLGGGRPATEDSPGSKPVPDPSFDALRSFHPTWETRPLRNSPTGAAISGSSPRSGDLKRRVALAVPPISVCSTGNIRPLDNPLARTYVGVMDMIPPILLIALGVACLSFAAYLIWTWRRAHRSGPVYEVVPASPNMRYGDSVDFYRSDALKQKAPPLDGNSNGQMLAEFNGEFTFNHEHYRMRSVVCRTCGFYIGAFNLHTYRDDPDAIEKSMRDWHDRNVHNGDTVPLQTGVDLP